MDLIKRTNRLSLFMAVPFAAVMLVIDALLKGERVVWLFGEFGRTPSGVLVGAALALMNLKGLQWGLSGLLLGSGASVALMFLSFMRLIALVVITAVLYVKGVVSILGIMAGITLVLVALLIEGLREAGRMNEESGPLNAEAGPLDRETDGEGEVTDDRS